MKLGFMSSVYPQQTLAELIATARHYGYEGIEFRTEWKHAHGIELGASEAQIAEARRMLADAGIGASCLATSVRFNSPDPAEHLPQRETLKQYVELAAALGAPCIRTFSDKLPEDSDADREKVLGLAAESYAAVDAFAGQHGVTMLVETHTNMRGDWARGIVDASGAEHLGVLWHIFHHLSRGQSVDEAYGYLREHVRHVHFALTDDVSDADQQRMVDLLTQDGYDGYLSVEIINPQEPAEVLRQHIDKYHTLVAASGR